MAKFIVTVEYRVSTDLDDTTKEMEAIEAQRWQMLQQKYGIEPLTLKVDSLKGNEK